jgi:PAS domain S-box-containing protein/putative nucleotidyltransferase with HDIG domain
LDEGTASGSDGYFQQFFNGSPDGVILIGPDGSIRAANPAQAAMYRYSSPDDLVGKHAITLVAPPCRDRSAEVMRLRLAGELTPAVEYELLRSDGTTFYGETTATVLRGPDGKVTGYVCTTRDTTERKRAETALQESERRYRDLYDGAIEGIYRTSLDGRTLSANRAMEQMLGYDPETGVGEVVDVGHQVWDTPEERARFTELLARQGVVRGYECEFVRRDRERMWVSLNARVVRGPDGAPAYYEGFVEDITERKQAEEALRDSDLQFRAFVEEAPVAISVTRNGIAMYANQALVEMLGRESVDEIIGRPVYLATAPQLRDNSKERIQRRYLGLPVPVEYETVLQRADGSQLPVHVAVGTVGLRDGATHIAFISDIADRRRAETDLLASRAQLEFTLKGAVAALGATTELRDPYTAGHQNRVALLACAIATELGFDEERVELLRTAALLHDIGKMVVPAEILSKPGRLSEPQMQLVRLHASAGAEIVGPIGFEDDVAVMIRQHHERLDGSGYPGGLHGGEVMAEARILAVADVVEAMTSHRPYRPALPVEAAIAELEAGAGTRYEEAACRSAIRLVQDRELSPGD